MMLINICIPFYDKNIKRFIITRVGLYYSFVVLTVVVEYIVILLGVVQYVIIYFDYSIYSLVEY